MEKSKVLIGVLAAGLAVSLVGNAYLWNSLNQKDTEYIAAMANLEEELAQSKEAQDTLRQQLEQTKADLVQVKSQGDTAVKEEAQLPDVELVYNEKTGIWEPVLIPGVGTDDPLEGMTPEEIDAWLSDTSGTPKPGEKPQQPEGTQGNTGDQGQTGNTGNTGGSSVLTPEQRAELQKILDSMSGSSGDDSRYHDGGGTGGNIGDNYTGPGINWN